MRRLVAAFAVVALLSASGASTAVAASSGASQQAAAPGRTLGVAGLLYQAKGARPGGGGGGGGASTTGYDISWPQCGKTLPSGQAFGIVGVNGGLANTLNPCLGPYNGGGTATSELAWAWGSTGNSKLPKAALYVNTANAGPNLASKWPTSGTNRYGTCTTLAPDSQACAWEYGAAFATQDMQWLADTAATLSTLGVSGLASDYTWWLDVETGNSWETGTTGLANNVADLQAMVATFEAAGAKVGIYSTSYQWGVITGGSTDYNLNGLPNWIPGARRQSSAQSNCSLPSFTGGAVVMTQWFGNPYDGDVAC
jgi:hypothetical protein